jgi:hypothetical protein
MTANELIEQVIEPFKASIPSGPEQPRYSVGHSVFQGDLEVRVVSDVKRGKGYLGYVCSFERDHAELFTADYVRKCLDEGFAILKRELGRE